MMALNVFCRSASFNGLSSGYWTKIAAIASRRQLSSGAAASSAGATAEDGNSDNSKPIRKSVFISQSYDVFANLALEDWIYKNYDLSTHHVLMLWANDPCVVIGRHQNPFSEANVSKLCRDGVTLARRNSGGGAVYHDRGNLNCTFFTARERYNRAYNLNIITRALFREYGIKADISERDDITLFGKKISGTAAKLGRPNAYHHCTLLVNSNKLHLSGSLAKDETEIVHSNATASVRSPIKNLCDVNKRVNIPHLLSAIGYEYMRTDPLNLDIECRELMEKQRGFQLINPTEKWFPGLQAIRDEFASWDWCIGRSPKFSVLKDVQLKSGITSGLAASGSSDGSPLKLKVDVVAGLIENVTITHPDSADAFPVVTSLVGQPYTEDNLVGIIDAMKGVSTEHVREAINGS